jgi:uncharacterized membrane protein YdjX (TVP38/TMEM64 family)
MDASTTLPARMRRRRRQMTLVVALIGLASFVTPLVQAEPISGRMRWSPYQILVALHAGKLPIHQPVPAASLWIDVLMAFGPAYVLLIAIVVAAVFLPSARFVVASAAIAGGSLVGSLRFQGRELREAIYGAPGAFTGHQVHVGTYCLVLLAVMAMLIYVGSTKELDDRV